MRRNPPALVDPVDVVRSAADRQLGIASRQSLEQRIAALERLLAGLKRGDAAPAVALSTLATLTDLESATPTGPATIAVQAAAGATATATINGNDETGLITIVPGGAGIAAGTLAVVSFAVTRRSTNFSILLQENSSAARTMGALVGPTSRSVTGWQLRTDSALTSGSTYQWFYVVKDY